MHTMRVDVCCESCSKSFNFSFSLTPIAMEKSSHFDYGGRQMVSNTEYRYSPDPKVVLEGAVRRCPYCGYIQSWMVGRSLLYRRVLWGVVCLVLGVTPLCFGADFITKAQELATLQGPNAAQVKALELYANISNWAAGVLILASILIFAGSFNFLLHPNRRHAKTTVVNKPEVRILT